MHRIAVHTYKHTRAHEVNGLPQHSSYLDTRLVRLLQKDILGFQIAVNDSQTSQEAQAGEHLAIHTKATSMQIQEWIITSRRSSGAAAMMCADFLAFPLPSPLS